MQQTQMAESLIYDSTAVQQQTYRALTSVGVLWRNRLNIESRFHSQRIYELKK